MAAIHAEHARPVLYFLLGLTGGDRHHAEDLLQETMLRAWRHIDAVPTGAETKRWLFTVARHLTIDAFRRRQRQPQQVQLTDLAEGTRIDETMGSVLAIEAIRGAVRALTSDQRLLLTELYIHGRPLRQVADRLGVPVGTVKSRAHRAVRDLRTLAAVAGIP
jgi:RNA polymerase sigma-70 factor (ECF subfamily)